MGKHVDWKANKYAPQQSWRSVQSAAFSKRYPDGKRGSKSIALAAVAIPLAWAAILGLGYSVLKFFGG